MKKLPVLILLVILLLNACATTATAVPPTQTPQPENTATATVAPTANSSVVMDLNLMITALQHCDAQSTYGVTTSQGATLADIASQLNACYGVNTTQMARNIIGWQTGWNNVKNDGTLPPRLNIFIYSKDILPQSSVLSFSPIDFSDDMISLLKYPPPGQTAAPTATPIPITYVTLGSPFAADCGDGIPRIWSNDSFDGLFDITKADDHHGHVDIFPPEGCDPGKYSNLLFIAPASGTGTEYDYGGPGYGYHLLLPAHVYPQGIEQALQFSGIDLNSVSISSVILDFGHLTMTIKEGEIQKGERIGNLALLPYNGQSYKIAYQVFIVINGKEYSFSPTLFSQDGSAWVCVRTHHTAAHLNQIIMQLESKNCFLIKNNKSLRKISLETATSSHPSREARKKMLKPEPSD